MCSFHEYRLFTDSTPGGLGNSACPSPFAAAAQLTPCAYTVPGRAILSRIIASMQQFTATGNQVVISHMHASYKPFLSIFSASHCLRLMSAVR